MPWFCHWPTRAYDRLFAVCVPDPPLSLTDLALRPERVRGVTRRLQALFGPPPLMSDPIVVRCDCSSVLGVPGQSEVSHAILLVVFQAHLPHNHTPRLRSRVALLELLIIVPYQLAIRVCHDSLLRVRVNRRSTVEMEPRLRYRCGEVWLVCDEELSQEK